MLGPVTTGCRFARERSGQPVQDADGAAADGLDCPHLVGDRVRARLSTTHLVAGAARPAALEQLGSPACCCRKRCQGIRCPPCRPMGHPGAPSPGPQPPTTVSAPDDMLAASQFPGRVSVSHRPPDHSCPPATMDNAHHAILWRASHSPIHRVEVGRGRVLRVRAGSG